MRREASATTVSARGLVDPFKAHQLAESSHCDDSAGDVDVIAAMANYSFWNQYARVRARVGLVPSHFDGSVTGACEMVATFALLDGRDETADVANAPNFPDRLCADLFIC